MIINFLATSPINRMGEKFGEEKMWATPVVKFASGADELYKQYKTPEICSEEHWLPAEIFVKFYSDSIFKEENLTVISWILPQTEAAKASMRAEK